MIGIPVMKNARAFTLIEVLIVVGIIGVLSAVVLASLNAGRIRGQETAIRSNLRNLSTEALVVKDETGSYISIASCATAGNRFYKFADAIRKIGATVECTATTDTYTVTANYPAVNPTKAFTVGVDGIVGVGAPVVSPWGDSYVGTYYDSNSFCTSQGMRLPTVAELLAERTQHGGTTPPGFNPAAYWTNQAHDGGDGHTYTQIVHMRDGWSTLSGPGYNYNARCRKQ